MRVGYEKHSHHWMLPPPLPPPNPINIDQALRVIAAHSLDADDFRHLLKVLGLDRRR
jgi:hypothetical protein